jgi:hypothetical protein
MLPDPEMMPRDRTGVLCTFTRRYNAQKGSVLLAMWRLKYLSSFLVMIWRLRLIQSLKAIISWPLANAVWKGVKQVYVLWQFR